MKIVSKKYFVLMFVCLNCERPFRLSQLIERKNRSHNFECPNCQKREFRVYKKLILPQYLKKQEFSEDKIIFQEIIKKEIKRKEN